MKTSQDPRHRKRIKIVSSLFAQSFHSQTAPPEAREILLNIAEIDAKIAKAAPQWPLSKVAKVDLAILRLATFELLFTKSEPTKVVIDEAIELAKEFSGETSSAFINGVLGTIIKNHE